MKTNLFLSIWFSAWVMTCFGQRPAATAEITGHYKHHGKEENCLKHFSADIVKADSILSASFFSNERRAPDIPQFNIKFCKDRIPSELNRDRVYWKAGSICQRIPEADP